MAKKVQKLSLSEFKSYVKLALKEALEEVNSVILEEEQESSLDEGAPPLTPSQKSRFEALKAKKAGGQSLTPEEKKEYLGLMGNSVAAKRDAAKSAAGKPTPNSWSPSEKDVPVVKSINESKLRKLSKR